MRIKENRLNNFSNFFNRSYIESIDVDSNDIVFQRKFAEPLRMRIQSFGEKSAIYQSAPGKVMLESKDIAEVMFLTKFIGNYNINKIGDSFIFENSNWAVALKRK